MPKNKVDILKNNNCVLVHCISFSQYVGDEDTSSLSHFEKLERVIKEDIEICCSTVSKGDKFNVNYTGTFGVILEPLQHNSIMSASFSDAGSTPEERRLLRKKGQISSDIEFETSIVTRNDRNEINLHSYKIIGIFKNMDSQVIIDGNIIDITNEEFNVTFPNMDFFLLEEGRFFRAIYDHKDTLFCVDKEYFSTDLYK